MSAAMSLWDVDANATHAPLSSCHVAPCTPADVAEMCRRYHYTGTKGGAAWCFGLYDGPTLLGVIAFNLPTRSVCASVFGSDHAHRVRHISRLAMADHVATNAESRLIGGALRHLHRDQPDVWAVVTYADRNRGHIGTVYQATNAIYCGTKRNGGRHAFYRDATGALRSDYLHGWVSPQRAAELGWTFDGYADLHRYVYVLGSARERRQRRRLLRWPSMPYPTQEREV